jgi:hypothetical protein
MHVLRRTALAILVAGGMVAVAAVPAAAGVEDLTVSGAAACDAATGRYTITWTITSEDTATGPLVTSATMNPDGSVLTVSPNPVPGTQIPPNVSTAVGSLPGTTTGPVVLTVVFPSPLSPRSATVLLDGLCTVAAVAVEAPVDFTG